MTSVQSLESQISDLSGKAWSFFGNVYTQHLVQVVKESAAGSEFNTHYYKLDGDDVATRVGGISFSQSAAGESSMSFSVTDTDGNETQLLDLTPSGAQITGGLDVLGDGISFDSPDLQVADESITLASGALALADIDQGGFVLGTDDSGKKTFLYSVADDYWSTNAGVNVESGYGFTVAGDEVVLNQAGLTVGSDVSISATGMTLGTVDPVVVSAAGIELGDSLSLTVADGLNIDDTVVISSTALSIGSGADIVTLDETGLVVGQNISLNASGLVAGDVSLDSTGLVVGTEIALSVSNGLTLGVTNPTVLDDTSLQLGASVLLNQEGVFFSGSTASIFMGPTNQWKISYDDSTENLRFQFYDATAAAYVTKMELKSTD